MRLILLIYVIGIQLAIGQVLDNRLGKAFTDKPFFNTPFIKQNKLKQLKGTFVYKKQGELMRTTDYKYVYNFDREGHLISTFETRKDDGSVDTTWNVYEYDNKNNLAVHRKTDQDGFTSVYYEYDSLDRVISEVYKREPNGYDSTMREPIIFNTEKSTYMTYDLQTKRTRYNNYDLPYVHEFTNYNDLGYLTSRVERFIMTSQVYTYDYSYDEKGKLAGIKKTSNTQEGVLEEFKFKYDELGNLVEKHIYRNGVFTTDIQFIYNSKTKLLATIMTKQVSTGFLMILRFKDYSFYN